MQGLITLDFGNTNPHAGLFHKHNNQWSFIKSVPLHSLQAALKEYHLTAANSTLVLSEVKSQNELLAPLIEQGFLLTRMKDYWRGQKFAGMPVHYAHSLGEDRLIEAFYVFKKYREATLIIDAGTFVTMDVVNSQGFMGGHIIPGLTQYFKNFQSAERLKETTLHFSAHKELPQTTPDAMSRSYQAFALLAKELITHYGIKKILVTGGSSSEWQRLLESESLGPIVEVAPDLIHSALHYWMTSQIEII